MANPPYTTNASFADYLYRQVSSTLRGILGWSTSSDAVFADIINDTLLVFDTSDITTFVSSKQVQQLRATARVYLWRTALQLLPTQYDISVDGSSFKRSQMLKAITDNMTMAENEAASLGVNIPSMSAVHVPNATIQTVRHTNDPYTTRTIYGVD